MFACDLSKSFRQENRFAVRLTDIVAVKRKATQNWVIYTQNLLQLILRQKLLLFCFGVCFA